MMPKGFEWIIVLVIPLAIIAGIIYIVYRVIMNGKEANESQGSIKAVQDANNLKKYKELLDKGVITQTEFDAKKRELLNG